MSYGLSKEKPFIANIVVIVTLSVSLLVIVEDCDFYRNDLILVQIRGIGIERRRSLVYVQRLVSG